jgi:hypothetical protein
MPYRRARIVALLPQMPEAASWINTKPKRRLRAYKFRLEARFFSLDRSLEDVVGLRHHRSDALQMTTTLLICSRELEVIRERIDYA